MNIAEIARKHAPTALGVVAAVALLVSTFHDVDKARVAARLSALGPLALLCLAPQLVGFVAESHGWRELIAGIGARVRLLPVLLVRVATEALSRSLPAGVVWCESLKPMLLHRHAGLPIPSGVAAAAGRKVARLWSHSLYLGLAFALGGATLHRVSPRVLGVPGLEWLVLGTALVLLLASAAVAFGLERSRFALRLHAFAARLPWVGARVARAGEGFARTDAALGRVGALRARAMAVPVLLSLVAWIAESAESWLVLRALGVDVGFGAIIAIEVTVSFARQLLFVVPAGVGVQDAGYVAFLAALGVPAEVGAAFVLIKRGIEVLYTVIGLSIFALPVERGSSLGAKRMLGA